MNLVARVRLVLARRPWLYWSVVVVLAALAAWAVAGAVTGVDDARRAWGATRQVVVAVDDIAPGEPLDAHTERRSRPGPAVSDAAIATVPDGAIARQHVAAGEALVEADIAPTAGPQGLIPQGWAAVAVAEAVPTGAAVGDRVTAVGGGVVLVADAVIVGHSGEALLVAVPVAEVAVVATAATSGDLALVLLR